MTVMSNKPQPAPPRIGNQWRAVTTEQWSGAWGPGAGTSAEHSELPLHRGLVVAQWMGARGLVTADRATWSEMSANVLWRDELEDLQQEARGSMPRAVVRDVAVSAAQRHHVPNHRGRPAEVEVGIAALRKELTALIADMGQYDRPSAPVQADFARRYGRLRDAVAQARTDFLAAEGMFEVVQARLVQFMDD